MNMVKNSAVDRWWQAGRLGGNGKREGDIDNKGKKEDNDRKG